MKKKWIITILAAFATLALAITVHWWVPWLLSFATKNKEDIDHLNTLGELVTKLVTWPATAILFIVGLWQRKKDKNAKQASAINVQTGGISSTSQGTVSVGGHVARDIFNLYQSSAPPPERVADLGGTQRLDDGRLTSIDWSARDQKLLHEYFSMCAKYDDDFKDHVELDESLVKEYFLAAGLAAPSPDGVTRLSEAGVLLCCKKKHLPQKDLHVNVKFQNKADPAELTEELYGSVMFLYLALFDRLGGLSQRKMGSANIRDASGGEKVFVDYPRVAIIEALVNFLIHRDYHCDDIGFITIHKDKIEFVNPGVSEIPIEELLAAETDIRPVYKRNPRLIEAMNKARLNQRAGSGLLRIKEELSRNGSHKPDGSLGLEIKNDEKRNRFALTIFRRETFDPRPQLSDKRSISPAVFQLPPPPADFTGRTTELRELRAAIEKGGIHISGLQGQGGVGKTALALKLAEELRPNYPDAQIYLDLKGVSENPLTAAEAMSHVLRTFHPEAKLPEKEEDLRAQYLSVLHNKRALLLMDNAKDAGQVKPLIPPLGCALLVTSRQHFALPGLQAKNLETLPPPDAKDLLLRIAPRIEGQAEVIAKLCGFLPQALRLAASAIAVRTNLEPRDYATQLADEKKRLELLAGEDESVTASIALSYGLLDPETQKRWRMLAVFPDTFDAPAAGAIWEIESDVTQENLSYLLQYSMLDWNDSTKRYRLHELVRDFARQQWTDVESDAAGHHSKYYGSILATAESLYLKGGDSIVRGLSLFDLEWPNIQAGHAWAAIHADKDRDAATLCSSFPDWAPYIFSLRLHPREQIQWREAALGAARQLRDRAAEGRHLGSLGAAYYSLGEFSRAISFYEQRLSIARDIGDRRGEGNALGNLGVAYGSLGDYSRAIQYYEQRLSIARDIGDRRGEGNALGNLGVAYDSLGEFRRAIEYHERYLSIARDIGDRRGEGTAVSNLGAAYRNLGDHRTPIKYQEQALAIALEIGDRRGESNALWNMSLDLEKLGDRKKASELAEAALRIFEQIEDPNAEKVREQLDIWRNG